ncbi:hypothetical protein AC070_06290 [Fannyhessea vaginae]|nr:hypothetical protein AC070_06290 [Fannyhessea vaginae]
MCAERCPSGRGTAVRRAEHGGGGGVGVGGGCVCVGVVFVRVTRSWNGRCVPGTGPAWGRGARESGAEAAPVVLASWKDRRDVGNDTGLHAF